MANIILWEEIKIPNGKTSGSIKTTCPHCSHTRKKKSDPCLSVDLDKGVAKCWNCDNTSSKKESIYTLPDQSWRNYTELSDNMVKWFKEERGLSQKTLIDCKITEEKYYQPSLKKNVNNIVFNYFYGDVVVNKKYRSANKKFTQCKNAKKIFYGINDVSGHDHCYIVEGEMDKLAFWEMGIENCISVPNGAKDLNDIFDTCKKDLEGIEKFYIAVDNDEPGRELEDNLVRRLGAWRCEKINFNHKDANDQIIKDRINFKKCVDNPTKYPISGTFSALDLKDDILDYYRKGAEQTYKPSGEEWNEFNEIFSILPGQLTTVTGIPSHGKSNWLEWYVISLLKTYDFMKVSFFSPEHLPMSSHQAVLAEKFVGKSFEMGHPNRMSVDEIEEYINWSKDRIVLTTPDEDESANWDWIFKKFKEQIFNYGTNIFVIDAFNKVRRNSPDSLGEISDILGRLTAFAQAHRVHIFLVAHPTKMKKNEDGTYEMPSLYDVKGSGDFRDQTHNGIAVYRHFQEDGSGHTEIKNLKAKFKHQGSGNIGKSVNMMYDTDNGRYYKFGGKKNRKMLIEAPDREPELNLTETEQITEQEYYSAGSMSKHRPEIDESFYNEETPF